MKKSILDIFLDAMSSERNFTRNTIISYSSDLQKFIKFQSKQNVKIINTTRQNIENFLKMEFDQGLSITTRARRLSSLKQFFKFLLNEELRQDDPTRKIKIAKKKGLKKIKAGLFEMNIGSKKVLEKNNFKLEGKMKSEIIYKSKRYNSYWFGKIL